MPNLVGKKIAEAQRAEIRSDLEEFQENVLRKMSEQGLQQYSSKSPTEFRCARCRKPFLAWRTRQDVWDKLPMKWRLEKLCQKCFSELTGAAPSYVSVHQRIHPKTHFVWMDPNSAERVERHIKEDMKGKAEESMTAVVPSDRPTVEAAMSRTHFIRMQKKQVEDITKGLLLGHVRKSVKETLKKSPPPTKVPRREHHVPPALPLPPIEANVASLPPLVAERKRKLGV